MGLSSSAPEYPPRMLLQLNLLSDQRLIILDACVIDYLQTAHSSMASPDKLQEIFDSLKRQHDVLMRQLGGTESVQLEIPPSTDTD
jgi:hypothetical protein